MKTKRKLDFTALTLKAVKEHAGMSAVKLQKLYRGKLNFRDCELRGLIEYVNDSWQIKGDGKK